MNLRMLYAGENGLVSYVSVTADAYISILLDE